MCWAKGGQEDVDGAGHCAMIGPTTTICAHHLFGALASIYIYRVDIYVYIYISNNGTAVQASSA